MKKVIVLLEILLIIWVGTLVANRYLAYFKIKPILTYNKEVHTYNDSNIIEYKAIGYKIIDYADLNLRDFKVLPFWKKIDYSIVKPKEEVEEKVEEPTTQTYDYSGTYYGSIQDNNKTIEFELVLNSDKTFKYYISEQTPYNLQGKYSNVTDSIVLSQNGDVTTLENVDSKNIIKVVNDNLQINYNNQTVNLNKVDSTSLKYIK